MREHPETVRKREARHRFDQGLARSCEDLGKAFADLKVSNAPYIENCHVRLEEALYNYARSVQGRPRIDVLLKLESE